MSGPWFHVEHLPPPGGHWPLSREEAKHATGAKRLSAGDSVTLFDGAGNIGEGVLSAERTRDGSVLVVVGAVRHVARKGRAVHLACALPKGDRLATLMDMTAQLGVWSVTPLRCERSVVGETEQRVERIRRIQLESCKQARVAWMPALEGEMSLPELVTSRRDLVVLHPGSESEALAPSSAATPSLPALLQEAPTAVTVCVGPEGGFTDREIAQCIAAGARRAHLGSTILRIETAAVVAVALGILTG